MIEAIQFFNLGQKNIAFQIMQKLEEEHPNELNIKYNYALMLGMDGMYLEEQKKYKEIIAINPMDSDTYVNLAISLNETKDYKESIQCSNQALKINPNIAEGYEARGIAKQHLDLVEEANLDFRKWLKLELKEEHSKYSKILMECLELIKLPAIYQNEKELNNNRMTLEKRAKDTLEKLKKTPIECIEKNNVGTKIAFKINRFYLAYHQKNDKKTNEIFCEITKLLLGEQHNFTEQEKKRENILGVISTFRYHPKQFIIEQLKQLDKNIKTILIVVNNPQIILGKIPENFYIEHINITPNNIKEAIKKIHDKNIDILFMPDIGMSIESQILAPYKLAKVSMMGWLHPVTSGSKNIDYFLSGELMETLDSQNQYTETLIKLPGVGLKIKPEDYISTTINELQSKNKNEYFKIGCLQTPFKYHPKYDYILIEIAKKIKKVNFIFIKYNDELDNKLMNRIKAEFEKNNLDPNIIKLQERLQKETYRNFLKTLDIALDTFGWSGGNTTLDCLGAGLPVLTMQNEYMRANHTAGIYKLIDEETLILNSPNELIHKIEELNNDAIKLKRMQIKIYEKFIRLESDSGISNFINMINLSIR